LLPIIVGRFAGARVSVCAQRGGEDLAWPAVGLSDAAAAFIETWEAGAGSGEHHSRLVEALKTDCREIAGGELKSSATEAEDCRDCRQLSKANVAVPDQPFAAEPRGIAVRGP